LAGFSALGMAGFYQGERQSPDKTVYVSNIPYESKWQDLKDFFNNEVGNVSFCDIFNGTNGPKGTGVVTFKNSQKAKIAVSKCHRKEFEGRKLSLFMRKEAGGNTYSGINGTNGYRNGHHDGIRNAGDGYGTHTDLYGLNIQFLSSLGIKPPLAQKVFVANLDYKVDDRQLRGVMKLAGKVLDIDFLRDKDGKSKGMALVEFAHPVEAVQAISMFHQQTLNDRPMSVRMDALGTEEIHPIPNKLPPGLKSIGMGLGTGGIPLRDLSSREFSRSVSGGAGSDSYGGGGSRNGYSGYGYDHHQRDSYTNGYHHSNGSSYTNGNNGCTISNGVSSSPYRNNRSDSIMVHNLPPYLEWNGFKDVFSKHGDIVYCELLGRSSGYVKYATENQAMRAIKSSDGTRLGNSILDVCSYSGVNQRF